MTTPERVNSDVILKAAQMARPRPSNSNSPWEIWDGSHGKTIAYIVFDIDGSISEHEEFNPLTSDADAMALERALKKAGWEFSCVFPDLDDACTHMAYMKALFSDLFEQSIMDKSDTLLLLKCVSAQFNIPMEAV